MEPCFNNFIFTSFTLPRGGIGRAVDTVWTVVAAFLVFWMQAGFEFYRAHLHFRPKIKIEIPVEEESLERILKKIRAAARLDFYGDGKIFVFSLN